MRVAEDCRKWIFFALRGETRKMLPFCCYGVDPTAVSFISPLEVQKRKNGNANTKRNNCDNHLQTV